MFSSIPENGKKSRINLTFSVTCDEACFFIQRPFLPLLHPYREKNDRLITGCVYGWKKNFRGIHQEFEEQMDKIFVPRLFTLYWKLLCDCSMKYLLKKIVSNNIKNLMSTPNFELCMKHLKVLVKWKFYLCLHYFSQLWNFCSRVLMVNCVWCYFGQLFRSLALRKF